MNRIIFYSLLIVAVTIPGAILAAVLVETEEDQLDNLIGGVEQQRLDSLLDAADFERGGLEVSAGSSYQRFDATQRDEALALLDQVTGISSAERVQVRQRQVTVRAEQATAILNIEVNQGEYVALRLNLSRHHGQWRVERIRVMG